MIPTLLTSISGEAALPLLVTFAIQATVLIIVSGTLLRSAGRRWSASNRHALLVGTALLLPCLIPTSIAMERQGLTWTWLTLDRASKSTEVPTQSSWKLSATSPDSQSSSPAVSAPTQRANTSQTEVGAASSIFPRPFPLLIWVWMAGMLAGLVWLMLGLVQLASASLAGRRAGAPLRQILTRLQGQWAPGTRVELLIGHPGEIPMTWGLFRHFIILPPEAGSWPASTLSTVLRHELSHVARHDFLWLTLARASLLVCWFHPLAWWLVRDLARTAEHASDDLATRTSSGRAAYARILVEVVSQCHLGRRLSLTSPFRLALAMAQTSALRRRVEALMDENQNRNPYSRVRLWWQTPLCGALIVSLATMTACKEKTLPSSPGSPETPTSTATPKETRIYRLSEGQRSLLLSGANDTKAPQDPFDSSAAGKIQDTQDEARLKALATKAQRHLVERAHISIRQGETPLIVLPDVRTMIVTTDEKTHTSIAKYLALHESGEQVLIRSFMLDVEPDWLPWQELGLQPPGKNNLQVQGVLTKEQGLKLMETIKSDQSVQNLTAAPSVTTRSGQRAHVDMVREFIYPTEFDPPQVLQPPASADGKIPMPTSNLPIMPTTPTAFEMRPVGLRMEFDPTVLPGNIHRIELFWEVTEFLGFVNYGTPIKTVVTDREGKPQELVISENKLQQPVFESMKLTTSFDLPDESFVVIGGTKPERTSPAELDKSSSFTPAMQSPRRADRNKPSMYILILQANLVKNPGKK